MARGPVAKTMAWSGFYGLLLFGTSAALVHRAYYGEGLVDFSIAVEVVGEELQYALAVGAILGMGLAALVSVLGMGYLVWHHRRSEKRELEEGKDDDAVVSSSLGSIVLPIAGAVVAAVAVVPLLMGSTDGFALSLAACGLLYGAAMLGLYLKTRRES
ncbi:hypothetical protein [Nesterenkonia muleiensis]|uniref:hypothetical protein n=1 Tax=Nesterenkonia muleiensis TaxID=2282648 RepID=UPI000E726DF1|nr:hypothetical protein [Nesterenkonia muleiensis]